MSSEKNYTHTCKQSHKYTPKNKEHVKHNKKIADVTVLRNYSREYKIVTKDIQAIQTEIMNPAYVHDS